MRPQKHLRLHTKLQNKLQKISQTSSPSRQLPQASQVLTLRPKINPSSLTSSYLKFKRYQQQKNGKISQLLLEQSNHSNINQTITQVQTVQNKNQIISRLQENIVRSKMKLTNMETCFQDRQAITNNSQGIIKIVNKVFRAFITLITNKQEGRQDYLRLVLNYSKERRIDKVSAYKMVIRWVLTKTRTMFLVINQLLKNCFPQPN